MESACQSSHSAGLKVVVISRQAEVSDFDLDEVAVVFYWLIYQKVKRLQIAM